MVRCNHTLTELLETLVPLDRGAELRLPQQQSLQQRMIAELEIRQHPQFFERFNLQVLRFIDDQQAAPAAARLFMEEALDGSERARLIMPFDVEAEIGRASCRARVEDAVGA